MEPTEWSAVHGPIAVEEKQVGNGTCL